MDKEFTKYQDYLAEWFKETEEYENQSKASKWFGHKDDDWKAVKENGKYTETGKKLLDKKVNELTKMKLRAGFHGLVSFEQAVQRYSCNRAGFVGKHATRACKLNEQMAEQIKLEYKIK